MKEERLDLFRKSEECQTGYRGQTFGHTSNTLFFWVVFSLATIS